MTGKRQIITLLPFLAAVAVVAAVGGWAAGSARSTYDALTLPAFAPPGWLFGPAWSLLYVLIAVAGWLLWRADGWQPTTWLWAGQLLLNLLWTPIFFGADRFGWALAVIVALDVAVLVLIVLARRRSVAATWLLVPYLAWILYATALNAEIVRLN